MTSGPAEPSRAGLSPATPEGPVRLSLILPASDEAASVPEVLAEFRGVLAQMAISHEIILVDDYSSDDTAARAAAVPGVRVLRNPRLLGYGHSLLRGMEVARGQYFAIADADGTYSAADLPALWRLIEAGADHAIGARQGRALRPRFGLRWLFRSMCKYVCGERLPDPNSGLRIFDRALVVTLRGDLCRGFSFTTSLTLASLLAGWVVTFHPITYRPRVGRSHIRRLRDTLRTTQYLVQLATLYNPYKLFLPLVLLSTLGGVAGLTCGFLFDKGWCVTGGLLMAAVTLLLIGMAGLTYAITRSGDRTTAAFRPRELASPAPAAERPPAEERDPEGRPTGATRGGPEPPASA